MCNGGRGSVLLHRDLPFQGDPQFDFFSLMQGRVQLPLTRDARYFLSRTTRVEFLGSPPVLATAHAPRQAELVRCIAQRLGRELDQFRGYRISLTYPPIPTLAIFHYPLPAAEDV